MTPKTLRRPHDAHADKEKVPWEPRRINRVTS